MSFLYLILLVSCISITLDYICYYLTHFVMCSEITAIQAMCPNCLTEQRISFQIRHFQPFTNQIRNYSYISFFASFENRMYLFIQCADDTFCIIDFFIYILLFVFDIFYTVPLFQQFLIGEVSGSTPHKQHIKRSS